MIILLVSLCIVSFVLGFLAASVYFGKQEQQKQARWDRQMQQMQQELIQAQEEAKQAKLRVCNAPSPQVQQAEQQHAKPRQAAAKGTQTAKDPGQAAARAAQAEAQYQKRLYEAFAAKGAVELKFEASFPDRHLICPGEGYVYNSRGELLPERTAFSRMNTTVSYAREGLFFLFDVVYRGNEYTFQQIMNGEMGNRFVRIRQIIRPARICDGGASGNYVLAKKGNLEVVDV